MVGAGKHHTFDAMLSRSLIQVVGPNDVALQDGRKRPFDRYAAQVDDGVNALDHGIDSCGIGQIGQHHFFARLCGAKILEVGQPERGAVGFQALAQGLAQAASRAGEQQFFVNLDRHFLYRYRSFKTGHFFEVC